jgi:hypothetical protein
MYLRDTERLIHFDRLRERLLVAGIAPRHVRRTLTELRDHYDDAVRDERERGKDAVAAEQAAWTRLGDEDIVAASVIARPELRSLPARYPKLIFGAGPVLLWIIAVIGTLLKLTLIVEIGRALDLLPPAHTALDPQWLQIAAPIACCFYARVLPVVFGLTMAYVAIRQRFETRWFVVGAALAALVGGFSDIHTKFAQVVGEKGELFISFAADKSQFGAALTITALEFALIVTPYIVWRKRAALT